MPEQARPLHEKSGLPVRQYFMLDFVDEKRTKNYIEQCIDRRCGILQAKVEKLYRLLSLSLYGSELLYWEGVWTPTSYPPSWLTAENVDIQ